MKATDRVIACMSEAGHPPQRDDENHGYLCAVWYPPPLFDVYQKAIQLSGLEVQDELRDGWPTLKAKVVIPYGRDRVHLRNVPDSEVPDV